MAKRTAVPVMELTYEGGGLGVRCRQFLCLQANGKVIGRTNYLKPDGKKDFGTGWKLRGKIKGWKAMGPDERKSVARTWSQGYVETGWVRS